MSQVTTHVLDADAPGWAPERGVVLSRGQVVRRGSAAELAADPALADLMAGA